MSDMEKKNLSQMPGSTTGTPDRAVISLFCGAGGLDRGFHEAGFRSILALDNDGPSVQSFNQNFPGSPASSVDLLKLQTKKFLTMVSDSVIANGVKPVGLIGGPPCQGVSRANSNAGPDDPRNSLMSTYLRLLDALESSYPIDFFVFENVPGLLSPRNKNRLSLLKRKLSKKFHVSIQNVDAADFGVPQHRNRVLIVGLHKDKFVLPLQIQSEAHKEKKTVRETIEGFPEPTFFLRNADASKFARHPNHWTMNPKSPKFTQPATGSGRSFRRLEWDLPSRTVAYGHREIHVHPNGHRRLSVFEAMLLQGFPAEFVLKGTLSAQVQQVSNAVPPPLAKSVAEQILKYLK